MRIVYLTDQMYLHGGAERIVSNKMNYLATHYGHEVYLITSEQKGKPFVYALEDRISTIDLEINYHREISYFHPKNLRKIPVHYSRLRRQLHKIKPDIIVQVSYSPDQYFLPWMLKSIPKIKEFHSSGSVMVPGSNQDRLSVLFRNYQALVALNESERQYYQNEHIAIIPNFTQHEAIEGSPQRKQQIIAAGRIAPVKQFDVLIDIWSSLAVEFPDWQLLIYGDGPDYEVEPLKKKIADYGIESNTKIHAAIPDLQKELSQSSLYAMTSATECFPMVLLEAQMAGLPIVSFDCPNGPRHILQNGVDGLLVRNQDQKEFASALKQLLLDANLRTAMGQNALQSVQRYSKTTVMELWNQLFQQIITEHRKK